MDVLLALFWTAIVCIVAYIYTIRRTLKTFDYAGIPYIPGVPILGNIAPTLFRKIQIGKLHEKFYYRFPNAKYFGMFDCNTPVIVIRDPELIKQVAIKNFDNFADHVGFTTDADKLFSKALFSLRGERWMKMRALLSPAFTTSKLKQMFEVISGCAKNFAKSLEEGATKGDTKFEMKDFTSRYTNDIICKYAFGINIDSANNPNNEIYCTGRKIFSYDGPLSTRFFLLKNFPWIAKAFRIPLFTKEATDIFTQVIENTIVEREKQNIVHPDMLQIMMNAYRNADSNVKVDMDDIMSQTFLFFVAGFDTTSSYLSSTLHILATHPEIQQKLLVEIDEVYEKTNGNPSYEAIQGMIYLNCVIDEVGRMYPPVPFLERMCTKTFQLPPCMPGYPTLTIKTGTMIYFPIYALQHDPKYFADPEKFDPNRFLDKTITNDSGYYIPFGIGRRNCIGTRLASLKMKLFMFHMLSRMTFKSSNLTVSPMKLATNNFMIVSHNGVWVQVEKRNKH